MSCKHCVLIWRQIGKINFSKHDIVAVHAELTITRDGVHKLALVREIAHLADSTTAIEKLIAWRRTNGFDRSEALAKIQLSV